MRNRILMLWKSLLLVKSSIDLVNILSGSINGRYQKRDGGYPLEMQPTCPAVDIAGASKHNTFLSGVWCGSLRSSSAQ